MPNFKITISKQREDPREGLNQQLQFLGKSLGLFSDRDKDNSCFRVFIELLQYSKGNVALTSDQIAYKTNLTRGTVIHHIRKLAESGLVIQIDNGYMLRVARLSKLVHELKKDVERILEDIESIANDIDEKLGVNDYQDLYNVHR